VQKSCRTAGDVNIHDRLARDMTDAGQTAEAADSALTFCQQTAFLFARDVRMSNHTHAISH